MRIKLLSFDTIGEVMRPGVGPDATPLRERFIGGWTNKEAKIVTLIRADGELVHAPFAAFMPDPDGTTPDFDRLEIGERGLSIMLGNYDVAACILFISPPCLRCLASGKIPHVHDNMDCYEAGGTLDDELICECTEDTCPACGGKKRVPQFEKQGVEVTLDYRFRNLVPS